MRFSILPLLLSATLAASQDPRIAKYHQAQQPQVVEAPSPIPAEAPSSILSDPIPIATSIPSTGNKYFNLGKKLFDATVLGKVPEEDTKIRDERDNVDGVERIMKENWNLIESSSKDDIWVIHISGPPRDFVDFRYLDAHKNATSLTKEYIKAGRKDMDNIHFARIDYMREADICTRWLIFRSPVLAFVTDQGRTVRWAPKSLVGAGGEFIFDILKSGEWKELPVWQSRYAPGGDRAYLIDFYLNSWDVISAKTAKIPSIVWMGLFAALTQAIVRWMSTPSANTRRPVVPVIQAQVPVAAIETDHARGVRERWEEAKKKEEAGVAKRTVGKAE